jgi:unsaturated rhamnogalacturonyl hydrolase
MRGCWCQTGAEGSVIGVWLWLAACGAPQDAAPRAPKVHKTAQTASILAEQATLAWPSDGLYLGWIESVWAFGVHRLHTRTAQPEWHDYYAGWLAASMEDFEEVPPRDFASSDSMSPAILASIAMREDPSLNLDPVLQAAERYLASVPTTANGAIVHWGVSTPFVSDDEVWIDSMFMFGMYLLSEYERTAEPAYLERFTEQYLAFSDLCRDEQTQLYRHAWDESEQANIPTEPVFWARGNSWVLVAGTHALSLLPPNDPLALQLAPLVTAHAEAIMALQADDGLWHTVLQNPDDVANYTETSASALLGFGLHRGLQAGLDPALVRPAVSHAVEGVLGRTEWRGEHLAVVGTSHGTNPGDYDYYVEVPTAEDLMLGIGTVVMLLAEVDGEAVE